MYDPQHLVDLHDAADDRFCGDGADPRSWLSGDDHHSSPPDSSALHRTNSSLSAAAAAAANVDPRLVTDILEIFPLVLSLMDRKPNASFTRRGSVNYTKTPSRESLYNKNAEAKGRNASQSILTKRQRDQNKNVGSNLDGCSDSLSGLSSRSSLSEKEREELTALREQVEDLQRKLLEKDELLKEVENSKNEIASLHSKLDEMQKEFAEKDSLLRSTQMQLSDAKIKLADKQAAVEKLEWEATTSTKKVGKLQEDLEAMQGEFSLFMKFLGELTKTNVTQPDEEYYEDYDASYPWDDPGTEDDLDKMQSLEAAREAYVAALATAKERQDESSISAAATARKHLESLVRLL
ncbi:PREDICTED: GRIP domain-containing protein RUD3 isoform X2 [Ipomoea nil]|uniref:GRIP domain-containing protein RUD3 isoform X2 n=1 Tax=Ipomoea nil TaxID=35883 RepID=UPI00090092D2|nr:PREDICTED: GRIP domain-containing protein RUD3 isoform X2 [Ipomoea nil]